MPASFRGLDQCCKESLHKHPSTPLLLFRTWPGCRKNTAPELIPIPWNAAEKLGARLHYYYCGPRAKTALQWRESGIHLPAVKCPAYRKNQAAHSGRSPAKGQAVSGCGHVSTPVDPEHSANMCGEFHAAAMALSPQALEILPGNNCRYSCGRSPGKGPAKAQGR